MYLICSVCGEPLDVYHRENFTIEINPCRTCMDVLDDEAYQEGYEVGLADADVVITRRSY